MGAKLLSIPNLLTLSRLAMLPVVIALFRRGAFVGSGCVFLVAMLTDCADGWVARKLRQESRLGLYLDPVVDKVLVIGVFYELALAGILSAWVPHLLLLRELLQSGVRTLGALDGKVVGANWMGKTKACLQTPVLIAALCSGAFAPEGPWASVILRCSRAGAWSVLGITWLFFAVFCHWNRRLFTANEA